MKIERIQPEIIRVNGKIVTLLGGEVSNDYDLTFAETKAIENFFDKEINIPFNMYINRAAKYYGVPADSLFVKSRKRKVVYPRQLAMSLLRKHTKLSFEEIGNIFGEDHSTVIYSCKVVKDRIKCKQTKL